MLRSDPWNDGKVGRVEAQRGHTLIVMVGEYCGGWGVGGGHTVWVSAAVTKGTVAGGGREGGGGMGVTHVLALEGVEEVSTQLAVVPRCPGRIADAT